MKKVKKQKKKSFELPHIYSYRNRMEKLNNRPLFPVNFISDKKTFNQYVDNSIHNLNEGEIIKSKDIYGALFSLFGYFD